MGAEASGGHWPALNGSTRQLVYTSGTLLV
jgi:hypothetical protein